MLFYFKDLLKKYINKLSLRRSCISFELKTYFKKRKTMKNNINYKHSAYSFKHWNWKLHASIEYFCFCSLRYFHWWYLWCWYLHFFELLQIFLFIILPHVLHAQLHVFFLFAFTLLRSFLLITKTSKASLHFNLWPNFNQLICMNFTDNSLSNKKFSL